MAAPHAHHHAPGTRDHGHEGAHVQGSGHEHEERAFGIGVALNLVLVGVEVVYGFTAHSMALLADAGHNLGDVLGLVLAGGAALLARRKPTKHRTYGYRRLTVLAALANAILLLLATGALTWESIRRLRQPPVTDAGTVMWVAIAAVVVNAGSASLFFAGRRRDLNVRAAFVHLAGDAAIALGVVGASCVIRATGWMWVDPAAGIAVSALILVSTWSLLRHSLDLVLDAVPKGIDIDEVRKYLEALPRVREVHDLHVWAMSTTEAALTAHLVMPADASDPTFLSGTCRALQERFGIDHSTLQVDPEDAPDPCRLAAHESV